MAYTPTLWAKGDIVTSEKLNKIEQGIVDKVDKVNGKTLSTNDYTNEDKAKLNGLESQIDHLESLVGSPLVASTAAEMTDEDKVYVYTGSETGYQNGNWYYYNGTTWTSGGVYNSVAFETDDTLSTQGMPADAKKTGDELLDLKEGLSQVEEITQNNIIKFASINTVINGVTITSKGNGILHFSGTANGSGGRITKLTALTEVTAGTYTFSVTSEAVNTTSFFLQDSGNNIIASLTGNSKNSFTLAESKSIYIGVNVTSGQIYNADYKIQVEAGSTATKWLPPAMAYDYIAREDIDKIKESTAKLPTKNLFLIDGSKVTYNNVIVEFDDKAGEVKFTGTANSSGGKSNKSNTFFLPAGTYTVSARGMTKYYGLFVFDGSAEVANIVNGTGLSEVSKSFTLAESANISIGFNVLNGTVYDDILCIQFEAGSEATDFVPPLSIVDYIARDVADKALVTASSAKEASGKGIVVKYDSDTVAEEDLVLESYVNGVKVTNAIMALKNDPTYNNSCRPLYCSIVTDGTAKKVMNSEDDGCPINLTSGYIGGGHGYNRAKKVTLTSHGKTYADIGSKWQDSNSKYFWIVSIIDADNIGMLGDTDSNAGNDYDLLNNDPSGTLTHVSGATNTSSINGFAVTTYQIEPLDMNHTKKIVLDYEREITESGTYFADMVDVVDEYDIANPRSIVTGIIANKPVGGYTENPLPNVGTTPFFHISNVYRFLPDGTLLVFNKVDCDTALRFGHLGGTQYAEKATANAFGGGCFKYIPDVLPINISNVEYDMREPHNMATWNIAYDTPKSAWQNADYPPDRIVTLFTNSNGKYVAGYTVGYLPIGGGDPSVRKDKVENGINLYSSKKFYPCFVENGTMNAYAEADCVTYRKPLLDVGNETHTCVYAVEYGDKCFMYFDYHSTADERIMIPKKYIGKNIKILHTTSGIAINEGVATDAIRVRCTSANPLANAVIELS